MIIQLVVIRVIGFKAPKRRTKQSRRKTKKATATQKIGNKWNSNRKERSQDHKSTINNIKILYKSREKIIKLFEGSPRTVSESKHKAKYGEGMKIYIPMHILQRLSIALLQVKVGNTSENLLNEIR